MTFVDEEIGGRSILLAEPNAFTADYIAADMMARGAKVLGPFFSGHNASACLTGSELPVGAALNTQLADGSCWSVADELRRLDIPFMLLVSSSAAPLSSGVPELFAGVPRLAKPFAAYQVPECLAQLCATKAGRAIRAAYQGARIEARGDRPGIDRQSWEEGLASAAATYVELYRRPPPPGLIERLCGVPTPPYDVRQGH